MIQQYNASVGNRDKAILMAHSHASPHPSFWVRLANGFNTAAELSNFGIAVEIISKILGSYFVIISIPNLLWVAAVSDLLIYFFRGLGRLTRLIGRQFNAPFEEEELGAHPRQNMADISIMALFSLTIISFVLAMSICPPMVFAAWAFGLSGVSIIYVVDYCHKENCAREDFLARKTHLQNLIN